MAADLVRRDSIEELCGHRARALELYAQASRTLVEARAAHRRAVIGLQYISNPGPGLDRTNIFETTRFADAARIAVDRDMWRGFVMGTPLGSLMDTQERKRFEDSLKRDDEVPEISADTVFATMSRLAGEADTIFRRGLVNAFQRLDRGYRSHDGFKIGKRIVLTYVVVYERSCDWLRTGYRADEELQDVDRVMHVLDGKPAPEYQQGIAAALRTAVHAWKRSGDPMECETEYWRLVFFKNGNGHLYPKRQDLVERANKLIAEHFGEVLGAGPDAARRDPMQPPGDRSGFDPSFFPTPPDVVARLLNEAAVEPHHAVLEPSAGTGAIAGPLAEIAGRNLTCYELDGDRADETRRAVADFGATVITGDFLDSPADRQYDRIVMNPPFARGQHHMHVLAAYQRLRHGGRLVSVMPAGFQGGGSPQAKALLELLDGRAEVSPLPAGSFRASGTKIDTVVLTLTKPEEMAAEHAPAEAGQFELPFAV